MCITSNSKSSSTDTRSTMDTYNYNGALKRTCLSTTSKQKDPASLYTMTGGSGAQVLMTRKTLLMSTNMGYWQQIRNKSTTENYILSRPITDISFETKIKPNTIGEMALRHPFSILNTIKDFFSDMMRTMIQAGLSSAFGAFGYFPYLLSQTSCTIDCDTKQNIYMDLLPDSENLAFYDCHTFDSGTDVVDAIMDYKRFDFCYDKIPRPIPFTFSTPSFSPKGEFFDCFESMPTSKEPTVIEKPFKTKFENTLNTSPVMEQGKAVCQMKQKDKSNSKNNEKSENVLIDKTAAASGPTKTKENQKQQLRKQQENFQQEHPQSQAQQPQRQPQPQLREKTISPGQSQSNPDLNQPKSSKNYRRNQRKKRRKEKRQRALCGLNKNRNEKARHELEQNIHDDIEDSMKDDQWIQEEDSFEAANTSRPTTSKTEKSDPTIANWITFNVTLSDDRLSEKKRTGCIFTSFINFELSDLTKKLKPAPDLTRKAANKHHRTRKQQQDHKPKQSTHHQRQRKQRLPKALDADNDENFIIFDENSPRRTFFWEPMCSDFQVTATSSCLPNTLLRRTRQRQISECSDDFICFEYDDNDHAARMQCDSQSTDEELSDDDDDEDEVVFDTDSENDIECSSVEHNPPDSGFEEKKVQFNLCPTVHEIRAWKFAYREARKGHWEQVGRDRERFENKIRELSKQISPVLSKEHREKIYSERFAERHIGSNSDSNVPK